MFGKHMVSMNQIIEIEEELEKLKADKKYLVGINDMRDHLGGHFRDYQIEIDRLERVVPKDCLSGFGRQYVDKTEDLLKRITQALNLGHIVPDGRGNEKQKRRLEQFLSEAEEFNLQYESNFVPDPVIMAETGQSYLNDAPYLWDYAGLEETHSRPFDLAYSALEGYPVYIAMRVEDFQANDTINRNTVQQEWLERVIQDNEPVKAVPAKPRSFLHDIVRKNRERGDF